MKIVIAVVCIFGIAFVSSAPTEEIDASKLSAEATNVQERAAEIPVETPAAVNEQEDRAAEIPIETPAAVNEQEDRAAEIPIETPAAVNEQEDRAAEIPAPTPSFVAKDSEIAARDETALHERAQMQERGIVPSVGEIVRALENKYLTEDGKSLVRSILPVH